MKALRFKIIFGLFIILTTDTAFAQNQDILFDLYDGNELINSAKCFTSYDQFTGLTLKVIKGNTANITVQKVTLTLNNKQSIELASYRDLGNFNLSSWLENHQAFETSGNLEIVIQTTDKTGNLTAQKLSYCLENSEESTAGFSSVANAKGAQNNYLKKDGYVVVPVFFATDRNKTNSKDPNERFGGKRGKLTYGVCDVSIPNIHKIGEIEAPSLWRLEFSEDPQKHIVLQKILLMNKDMYFKRMSENIKKSSKKSSFLFVHGYNVSFADAAKRTAQITYDLRFDGEAVFYSWPSQASTTAYTVDESNIEWAQTNIKNFIADYITHSEAEEIYLVAHSMGNRGLTRALVELLQENPELNAKIKEVILAAPDIDADVFKRDIAPKMVQHINKPITLYVSSDDVALHASRQVHGSPRAGDAGGDLVLVKGVETIDASGIDTSFLSHSYFAETPSIVEDIFDLVRNGTRAAKRKMLQSFRINEFMYWKVIHP